MKKPLNRWLTLFVLFAFLFNACSTPTQNTVVPVGRPTGTYIPPTQTPTEAITSTPTPAVGTATPEATATEAFAPMNLSPELSAGVSCTWDDITSGRLAWNARQIAQPFPPDAQGGKWKTHPSIDSTSLYHEGSDKLLSICKMPSKDSPLGVDTYVLSFQVLSSDNKSWGILNVVSTPKYISQLLSDYNKNKEIGLILNPALKNDLINEGDAWAAKLLDLEPNTMNEVYSALSTKGAVSQAMESELFILTIQ